MYRPHLCLPHHHVACPIVLAACLLAVGLASAQEPTGVYAGNTVLVPMRSVFEWLGASVTYKGGHIKAVRGGRSVALQVGSRQATVGGQPLELAAAPALRGGTTYVPLRFVAESMGASVAYQRERSRAMVVEGGRSLPIHVSLVTSWTGNRSIDIACEALAALLQTEGAEGDQGRPVVFLSEKDHRWMRQSYPNAYPCGDSSDLEADPRFRATLRRHGGKPGDVWYLYQALLADAHCYEVMFPGFNWEWRVCTSGGFTDPQIESIEYEGEVDSTRWRARRTDGEWHFTLWQ